MNNETKKQINEIIAEILEIEPNDITFINRDNNTNWDSLKHLEIIMALEEELDIRFSATEVTEIKDVEDFYRIVSVKMND